MTADEQSSSCCAPARDGASRADEARPSTATVSVGSGTSLHEFVDIPAGEFTMGTDAPRPWPSDGEGPARRVRLGPYRISPYAVTNDQYARFVGDTGYVTDAERYGWTFVFHLFLPDDFPPTRAVAAAPWWRQVEGADWAHPFGPQSDLEGIGVHPVVHVSWNDAQAYCTWAEVRLPTEAEWERAGRGGLDGCTYPWGDEFAPDATTMCNIFEGTFPTHDTGADGWVGTAPVDTFPPNGFGLHNVAANAWEWCADWFSPDFHRSGQRVDPVGPPTGRQRVMRGGSHLCHDSYCDRYKMSARSSNDPDASTGNLGFRVAIDS